jgi:hypothetical protein
VSAGLAVGLILAGISVAAGLVYVFRARTARDRVLAVLGVWFTVLLWGGPLMLWSCGENDCGALVPGYWVALALSAVALAVSLRAGRT